jgi:ABC-type nitrate/sulfonate/bicarbonate transport system ATPase subunit
LNSFFRVENISKSFITELGITHRILNDFSFEISEVEKASIIGMVSPFASGKSTLLKIFSGIEKFDSGRITFYNNPFENDLSKFIYLSKNPSSLPWYNVYQNIELPFKLNKINPEKVKISEIISLTELDGYEEHFPHEKSKGFRFRICLARCLAQSPEIIFMDESFRDIDDETKSELQELLIKVKRLGVTIVYATSNINDIIKIADTVYLMNSNPLTITKKFNFNSVSDNEKIQAVAESLINNF